MRFGLKETTIKQINQVFSNHPQVKSVMLYGSRAKGDYRTGSDIDLTLIGEELTLLLIHKIELDLDDLLLPYTFDLSVLIGAVKTILWMYSFQLGVLLLSVAYLYYILQNHF